MVLLVTARLNWNLNVSTSFENQGYLSANGYPLGYFLCNSKLDWVFLVVSGQHRIAAMASLGFEKIPVQIYGLMPRIVYERDVNSWPMVANSVISKKEALEIFNSCFSNGTKA